MKVATIFAITGVIAQLVWSLLSGVLTQFSGLDINYKVIQAVWMIVGTFSSVTLLAFLITFLSNHENLGKNQSIH